LKDDQKNWVGQKPGMVGIQESGIQLSPVSALHWSKNGGCLRRQANRLKTASSIRIATPNKKGE